MIGLRRRNPWLVDAMIETEQVDNARLVIRARARHGEQSLALALNLTGEPFALPDSAEVLEAEPDRRRWSRGSTRLGGHRALEPSACNSAAVSIVKPGPKCGPPPTLYTLQPLRIGPIRTALWTERLVTGLEQRLKHQDDAPKNQAGGDREHQRPTGQPGPPPRHAAP